jgi:N-acetylglucosamine-6-sulfatase
LRASGYRTALVGKYFNGYGGDVPTVVPPGWDEWYANYKNPGYYDYTLNENGQVVSYGSAPGDYKTDVLATKATDYLQRSSGGEKPPFSLYLAPTAPHEPATPAPRHENAFPGAQAPRTPSFNEANVNDKPEWISSRRQLTAERIAELDALNGNRLRSLLAVDDMIESLVDTLRESGELDNTYIFFTSDNGHHLGQHRLTYGKWTAYEEDIRVPLIVRGPGVPTGQTLNHLMINNDYAPTFAELGAVSTPSFVDGRSFVPLLQPNPPLSTGWRSGFLVESVREGDPTKIRSRPGFEAVRTDRHLYVEYESGERELYNLNTDPDQLSSRHPTAGADLISRLQGRLSELSGCVGEECRTAEGG